MYRIKCDGYTIYDPREDEYIVTSPKCKLEVNTVGEASFSIYSNHPNYDKLKKMRSVFEIFQDNEIIFRGRMTDDTIDFNNVKSVDIEGVLAYFNDSIIRPFNFPDDFLSNPEYGTAEMQGNVVEFFLNWIIEQHNSQVQQFQTFKLGNVTVSDKNNYITRSSNEYLSSWEIIKTRLFESSLGGYLCIRYEDDGNYIDYLEDFESENEQKIEYGENLLDFTNESDASTTYTAVIPLGAKINEIDKTSKDESRLTIGSISDGNITDDIVKKGDTLYSKSAVEKYGWIYAPIANTTYENVKTANNLLNSGLDYISSVATLLSNTATIKAVDLHFSDREIEMFRIYRYINVYSKPHNHEGKYKLSKLEIDLVNPQSTVITIGDTRLTLTDLNNNNKNILNSKVESIKQVAENSASEITDIYNKSAETSEKVETMESKIAGLLQYFTFGEGEINIGKLLQDDTFNVFLKTVINGMIQFSNNNPLYGTTANGNQIEALNPCDENGNTVIGNGNYNSKSAETVIRGKDVKIGVSNVGSPEDYKPYFSKGDTIDITVETSGYVTSSGKSVRFLIPLSKPVVGSPTVTVESINGFELRQAGKYTHGSASGTFVSPDEYIASLKNGCGIGIRANFSVNTNVTSNNETIGIYWNGRIKFT